MTYEQAYFIWANEDSFPAELYEEAKNKMYQADEFREYMMCLKD